MSKQDWETELIRYSHKYKAGKTEVWDVVRNDGTGGEVLGVIKWQSGQYTYGFEKAATATVTEPEQKDIDKFIADEMDVRKKIKQHVSDSWKGKELFD